MALTHFMVRENPGSDIVYCDTFLDAVMELRRRGRRLGRVVLTRTGRWFVSPRADPGAARPLGLLILVRDPPRAESR
jgi:uncharacterized NAD(P)/FAD-binding protein YdhS